MSPHTVDGCTAHEALAAAKADGAAGFKAAEENLSDRFKLLTAGERAQVEAVLERGDAAKWASRDALTAGELKLLTDHGLAEYVRGRAAAWAFADKDFPSTAKRVWERVPDRRTAAEVLKMADAWGLMDSVTRGALLAAMGRIEKGERFNAAERDLVLAFAGERYFVGK
jgi:hypothetical protein